MILKKISPDHSSPGASPSTYGQRRPLHTLEGKLTLAFLLATAAIFAVNLFLVLNINTALEKINRVFYSNVQTNTLSEALDNVQQGLADYLSVGSSENLRNFYQVQAEYTDCLAALGDSSDNVEIQSTTRDIRNLSEHYTELCENALTAKRGRNIQRYKNDYEDTVSMNAILQSYIYSMNNLLLKGNSDNYLKLADTFHSLEAFSLFMIVLIAFLDIFMIVTTIRHATAPMHDLIAEAGEIGKGNFDVPPLAVSSDDELGIVASAFNEMVVSMKGYLQKLRESMESENRLKERELLMDAHLKEAELKYLQAQINPHFLFNTLNAGAQLAMMEEADGTYRYLQNVAAFFRNKTNRENQITTLADEIALADNYMYIINVRFSDAITYEKRIDEDLTRVSVPSMILQPIIENAINHGVRDIDRPAVIILSVYRTGNYITLSVRDNGRGMTEAQMNAILSGNAPVRRKGDETNGVGLSNVINRMRLFYNSEDVFDITSPGEDRGTEVLLYIPMP
ncbi:MAG: histidine kinase [Bilifractor sp.]|nr:histidine kinase [Lachnospiraceae bacterium]MDY2837009.1 histidine kinase [Bilifractor sp.]